MIYFYDKKENNSADNGAQHQLNIVHQALENHTPPIANGHAEILSVWFFWPVRKVLQCLKIRTVEEHQIIGSVANKLVQMGAIYNAASVC